MEWRGAPFDLSGKRELLLWAASFLVVLMAHASAALVFYVDRDEGEVTSSSATSAVYYATLPMMDAPAREIAAGQEQVQTDAASAARGSKA